MRPRLVLFHYHLFKNAGTSLDKVLHENFGSRWLTREFEDRPAEEHAQEVQDWLEASPDALAFSSHTALLPPPRQPGLQVFPLVFLRHPLDRIASAYSFERKQLGDHGFGAALAQSTSLAGYIRTRLTMPQDRQCRNFQTARLAPMYAAEAGSERERAVAALQRLPFVGIVEHFDASMAQLTQLIAPAFPEFRSFSVMENSSRGADLDLAARLAQLRETLGDEVYALLEASNADDLVLYDAACELMAEFA
ncbi:sulfotransferase family protein [Ideonella azotifigens]|uniref:Sulfotransferase family 2 domain-containing protein n=1 Tax=Ideonella azotifigens TaxID=513160 RepID=A0ABN1JLW0_9BURK|nr:sulfotransferase family 2 domain-containing protein [Ideonella azotifigens]MCD2339634.1 sulfotransferase family protein [Ideonella azotifigens]